MKSLSAKVVLAIIVAALAVGLTICLVPAGKAIDGLTVLDSRLHLLACQAKYAKEFEYRPKGLRAILNRFGIPTPGKSKLPLSQGVLAYSRSNQVGFVFAYDAVLSQRTNFAVEVMDPTGKIHPTQMIAFSLTWENTGSNSTGSYAMTMESPDVPRSGEYEFRILLKSNGPVLAKYLTKLEIK